MTTNSTETKLKRLLKLGNDLNQIHDPDALMERILKEARFFCNADAGSIYIAEGNYLKISYIQNNTLGENKIVYHQKNIPIDNSSIAGFCAKNSQTVLLNDVTEIMRDSPFKFNPEFDRISGYNTRSMLSVPMKGSQNNVIGVLQIINPYDSRKKPCFFTNEDKNTLWHFAGIAAVALQKAKLTRAIILKMIRMAELHDPSETGAHVNRVSSYSVFLYTAYAEEKRLNDYSIERDKDILKLASMVHDIGKVAISDIILKKPGPLTDEEFNMMKKHTVFGAEMFENSQSSFEAAAKEIALNHHQRWDGKGYPEITDIKGIQQTKRENEIPLFARIVSIADVFDALSSKRCYKDQWPAQKVAEFLKENAGTAFDPFLIELFLKNTDKMYSVQEEYQ
jgi:HD-GYP domain-containing protein (c-di-GMP phosphodiesterase class II)